MVLAMKCMVCSSVHLIDRLDPKDKVEVKEFFPLFNLVMDIGERITRGIAMPNLYE